MLLLGFIVNAQKPKMKFIFNGKNLDGWYSFLRTQEVNKDPDKVFTVENGLIHVSGKDFGYISTHKSYQDFHLMVDFKWGEKKYPPRENDKRDSGILFFIPENKADKIWPRSLECQIQEGDVGDMWLIDSATVIVNGNRTIPKNYTRVEKKRDNEKSNGQWNTVEVLAKDGKITYSVNGQIVNEAEKPNLKKGKILLQSEGAEIYYRNIRITEL